MSTSASAAQLNNISTGSKLTVRRLKFEYPDDTPAIWTPNVPEFSWAANALSLMMPHVEPYFVSSVRAVLDDLPAAQQDEARQYIRQEAAHHSEHKKFNTILCQHYPRLKRVDRTLDRFFSWLRHRKSGFNVAFTAGSETIAYAIARWAAKRRVELFTGADPDISALFLWHLAEEIEHKSAAYDIKESVGIPRFTQIRALAAAIAVWATFTLISIITMAIADKRWYNPVAWFRLAKWAISFGIELLTDATLSALPNYDPRALTDPLWYEVWLREYEYYATLDPHAEPNM